MLGFSPVASSAVADTGANVPAWIYIGGNGGTARGSKMAVNPGSATGDLIVFIAASNSANAPLAPTGFSTALAATGGTPNLAVFYKIADGSEGGLFTCNGSLNANGWVEVVVYRAKTGSGAVYSGLDVVGTVDTSGSSAPSITTTSSLDLALAIFSCGTASTEVSSTTAGDYTERLDSYQSTGVAGQQISVYDKSVSAGSTGLQSVTWSGPVAPTSWANVQIGFKFAPVTSLSLSPSLFTNTETFHAPTVTVGSVNLAPTLVSDTDSFFAPTVTRGAVNLAPTRYDNTQTFHAPTVTRGAVNLAPSLLASTENVFSPTVTASFPQDILVGLYENEFDVTRWFDPTVTSSDTTTQLLIPAGPMSEAVVSEIVDALNPSFNLQVGNVSYGFDVSAGSPPYYRLLSSTNGADFVVVGTTNLDSSLVVSDDIGFRNGVYHSGYFTDSTYYTSTDGVTWTPRTFPTSFDVGVISSFGPSVFFGITLTYSTDTFAFYTSNDCINWSTLTDPLMSQVVSEYASIPQGKYFFLRTISDPVTDEFEYVITPDGVTWTALTMTDVFGSLGANEFVADASFGYTAFDGYYYVAAIIEDHTGLTTTRYVVSRSKLPQLSWVPFASGPIANDTVLAGAYGRVIGGSVYFQLSQPKIDSFSFSLNPPNPALELRDGVCRFVQSSVRFSDSGFKGGSANFPSVNKALTSNTHLDLIPRFFDADATRFITPARIDNTNSFYAATVSVVSTDQTLTATRYDNTSTVYAPTVTAGAVNLSPTRLDNAQSIYTPTITVGPVALAPSLVTNSSAFYAPVVTPGSVNLTASQVANTSQLFDPTVTVGTVTLAQNTTFVNTQTFYAPIVVPQGVVVAPTLYNDSDLTFAPIVTSGGVTLTAPLLSGAQTFYDPTVTPQGVVLSPTLYNDSDLTFSPTVTTGSVSLTVPLLTNTQTFYDVSVSIGAVTLSASRVDNANTFYSETVSVSAAQLYPSQYNNASVFYSHTVTTGSVSVAVPLVTNSEVFFTPTVQAFAPEQTLSATLYSNTNSFFNCTAVPGAVSVVPALYNNTNTFYTLSVSVGSVNLQPTRADNTNTLFAPTAQSSNTVLPSFFSNVSSFYTVNVSAEQVTLYPTRYDNQSNVFAPELTVVGGSYILSQSDVQKLGEIWRRLELDKLNPVVVTKTTLDVGTIHQELSEAGASRSGAFMNVPPVIQPPEMITEIWQRLGLDENNPLTQNKDTISFGASVCNVVEFEGSITVTRQ